MSQICNRREPTSDEQQLHRELMDGCLQFMKVLDITIEHDHPKSLIAALSILIERYRKEKVEWAVRHDEKLVLIYGSAELFARAVLKEYGWSYEYLERNDGLSGFAVVSRDERWCVFVHHYFFSLFFSELKENNLLRLYRILDPQILGKLKSKGFTKLS